MVFSLKIIKRTVNISLSYLTREHGGTGWNDIRKNLYKPKKLKIYRAEGCIDLTVEKLYLSKADLRKHFVVS